MSACHCYVGVRARIDEGPETVVTIAPDGCRTAAPPGATLPCEAPELDQTQAWSVALFLTGDDKREPRGGAWHPGRKAITYSLSRQRRMMMT